MGLTLVTLIFFAFITFWVLLPFLPGLREIRERRDVEPLRVVRDSEVDVVHFARGFRRYLEAKLAEPWARARASGERIDGALGDGTRYLVLGAATAGPADVGGVATPCDSVVLACGDLELAEHAVFTMEVFAEGRINGGARSRYRALLADGDLELGAGTQVLRWSHAGGAVTAATGSELYGRLSAARRITLEAGCRFDRLHAPAVEFGTPADVAAPRVARTHFSHTDLLGVTDVSAGRWLIKGDLAVPEGGTVESDVVVVGRAELDDGAVLIGSIKAHGDLVLGRGVEILGSAVSRRNVHMAEGCRVHGPVISERRVTIGTGTRIGTPELATTVSAATIVVATGAVVHGTVWAHQGGEVRAAEGLSPSRTERPRRRGAA